MGYDIDVRHVCSSALFVLRSSRKTQKRIIYLTH